MIESENTGRFIFRVGTTIYIIKALSILLGLGTWAVLAFMFGTGRDIEAYFAAVVAYDLAGRIMQPGAAASVLVPLFIRAKATDGMESAWALVSMVVNTMTIAALALTVMLILAAPWVVPLLVPGFDDDGQATVVTLVRLMSIAMVSLPIIAIANAALNANGQFAKPEIFTLIGSIAFLTTIIVGVPRIGVVAVGLGAVFNAAVTMTGIMIAMRRQGYRHSWASPMRDDRFRAWARALRPSFAYMVIMQPRAFVLTAVLSLLPPGSMAIYRYASELVGRVGLYVSGPLGKIALPTLSRIAESQGTPELKKAVAQSLKLALIISLPVFMILLLASGEIVRLFLNYGRFTEADVRPVSVAVVILAVTVIFQSLNAVLQRTFVVIQRTGWQNVVLILGQLYSLTLILLLVPRWGFVGAAWHNLIGLLALLVTGFIVLLANRFAPDPGVLLHAMPRVLFACIAALLVGWGVAHAGIAPAWLGLLAIASTVTGVYIAVNWILRVDEIRLAASAVFGRGGLRSNLNSILRKV